MDDSDPDLVIQLCTRIGMIMEDASVFALTMAGQDQEERERAVVQLEQASAAIAALAGAVRCLMPR